MVCSNVEEFPRMDILVRPFHDLAATVIDEASSDWCWTGMAAQRVERGLS